MTTAFRGEVRSIRKPMKRRVDVRARARRSIRSTGIAAS